MKLDQRLINQINRYFQDKPVVRAYFFGSFGREDADEESDIDILVELDYSEKIGLKFFRMKTELEKLLDHKVDLVSNEALSPLIKSRVDQDRKLLYERS